LIFQYKGRLYPEYLKQGGASQYVAPLAKKFCQGIGLYIGCGKWPLDGAVGIDINPFNAHEDAKCGNALKLKVADSSQDYIFSSHCLEHVENPIAALEHWKSKIKAGGILFLYLPHPNMEYWLPQNCRKHLHSWQPSDMARIVSDLGFINVIHSDCDLAWSFCVVGIKPEDAI
jgi:SAM-dependent methyltransferase